MVGTFRPRRLASAALLGALALGLAACGGEYPNSTFNHNTDFNADIDALWDKLLFWGTIVFVGVEAALVYTIFRFRRRPGGATPKQVHGNTALEITWTAIPAVILIFIAIPTVRTIFKTQAKAAPDALQVEVIGHQWWWEFKYPQLGITTANELYLPNGRTVNFQLKTVDVLHSFWIPQMGGKRDLISNRTNYLWFTPTGGIRSVGRAPEAAGDLPGRGGAAGGTGPVRCGAGPVGYGGGTDAAGVGAGRDARRYRHGGRGAGPGAGVGLPARKAREGVRVHDPHGEDPGQ